MRVLWVSLAVLLIDQATKVLVKTRMTPGEIGSIPLLGDWLKFTFTENPGMAFGITFGMPVVVTIFAIIATFAIVAYLWAMREGPLAYRTSLAFILGGAVGNIIDRAFYGRVFDYGGLFQGRVVDFIHVDLYNGRAPDWMPLVGGDWVSLFPIWNVADMAIVCGVVAILILQHRFRPEEAESSEAGPSEVIDLTEHEHRSPENRPDGAVNGYAPPPPVPGPAPGADGSEAPAAAHSPHDEDTP